MAPEAEVTKPCEMASQARSTGSQRPCAKIVSIGFVRGASVLAFHLQHALVRRPHATFHTASQLDFVQFGEKNQAWKPGEGREKRIKAVSHSEDSPAPSRLSSRGSHRLSTMVSCSNVEETDDLVERNAAGPPTSNDRIRAVCEWQRPSTQLESVSSGAQPRAMISLSRKPPTASVDRRDRCASRSLCGPRD
jgi:hypothetical protein